MSPYTWVPTLLLLLSFTCWVQADFAIGNTLLEAKCSYGERGSLTATCYNATPGYFKSTMYKFDHLDETLRCVNCNLTVIESNSFDLSGNLIRNLDLRNSHIELLKSKAFMGLVFLETLDLSQNRIRAIFPGTFTGTKKIRSLNLTDNLITALTFSGFAELKDLQVLSLHKNQIKVIDEKAFVGLSHLTFLDLSYNYIESVNNSLHNLTELQEVNLKHNNIRQVTGKEFEPLGNLMDLNLAENSLNDQFALYLKPENSLRKLVLAHNKITSLWFSFSYLDMLEYLDVSYNNIVLMKATPFEGLHNLRELYLDHNKINEIKTGQLSGLSQLQLLNCSYNCIEQVAITGVYSLLNIHTLDLSHNNLTQLDYIALIARLPSLSYLSLQDNRLPCDLENEMERDFAEDNFKYVLVDERTGFKCDNTTSVVKSSHNMYSPDTYIHDDSTSASDIVIFILLSVVILAIGILFYIQYLFYKGVRITFPGRVESTMNLISANNEQREEDEFENVVTSS